MIVVSKPLRDVQKIIGQQEYWPNKTYNFTHYMVEKAVDGGMLLYQTLTREIIFLTDDEYIALDGGVRKYLVQHWFMVDDSMDERTMVYMFWQTYNAAHPRKKYGLLNLVTIFTTTACNAHCPYCYEAGSIKRSMSEETALDVAKYIRSRCADKVHIKWFGGEPLCNAGVINIISDYLQANNIQFDASMVSNGYLFDQHTKDEIQGIWKLRHVQITLDGTEEVYNQTKRFAGVQDSPYQRVMDNIQYLLDMGLSINVRMNLSMENGADLFNLVDILAERFGKYPKFKAHVAALFEGAGETPLYLSEWQREAVYDEVSRLQQYMYQKGLSGEYGIPKLKRCHCMADNGRSCVILPGGELSLCEHHYDDEYYGSIYSNVFDRPVLDSWLEREEPQEACKTCFYYPQCMRLAKCPAKAVCGASYQEYKRKQVQDMMNVMYIKYAENRDKEEKA